MRKSHLLFILLSLVWFVVLNGLEWSVQKSRQPRSGEVVRRPRADFCHSSGPGLQVTDRPPGQEYLSPQFRGSPHRVGGALLRLIKTSSHQFLPPLSLCLAPLLPSPVLDRHLAVMRVILVLEVASFASHSDWNDRSDIYRGGGPDIKKYLGIASQPWTSAMYRV